MEHAHSVKKQFVFGVMAMLISASVAVMIAEVLLHIVKPEMNYAYMPQALDVSHFRPSSVLPFELRRNNRSRFRMLEFDTTVITNSLGLRDDEVDFSRPRIICLGDSFTFGFGVENREAFCALLERLFGGRYDFLNAGVADGLSPDTYALWLSTYLDAVNADGMVATLHQNDFLGVSEDTWLRGDAVMTPDDPGLPDRIVRPDYLVTDSGALIRDTLFARLPPSLLRLIKRSYLVGLLRDRLLHDVPSVHESDVANVDHLARERKFLRSLGMLADVAGEKLLAFYLIANPGHTGSRMDELTIQFAAERGVPVLSNFEDFSSEDLIGLDHHWNKQGHVKAAGYLYQALSESGL